MSIQVVQIHEQVQNSICQPEETGPVRLYMGTRVCVSNSGLLSYLHARAHEHKHEVESKTDLKDCVFSNVFIHKHSHIHPPYSISSSISKRFSQFFPPHCICQTVVNFISELQEQMCRFQKEINSKIQEKKALEVPADSNSPVACPTESTEGQASNPGPSCDRTSGVMHKLEEAPDGPDGNTHSLEEGSSDAEQQYHCGGESVGTAGPHDF